MRCLSLALRRCKCRIAFDVLLFIFKKRKRAANIEYTQDGVMLKTNGVWSSVARITYLKMHGHTYHKMF